MSNLQKWTIDTIEKETTTRYCSGCKKKVTFYDTGVIRRNANGKDIFEFAIHKCDKNHTWNKKLRIYKPDSYKALEDDYFVSVDDDTKHDLLDSVSQPMPQVATHQFPMTTIITHVKGQCRIDKLLSDKLATKSRSTWQKK